MQQKKRLNLIQASRAIVPLLVLTFHMSFVVNEHFNYNFLNLTKLEQIGGADYFFVLTGFMIFYVYFKDIGNKEKFRPFLIKRFIGIYPFYWIVTCIVCVFFFFIPVGYGYSHSMKTILGSLSLFPWQEDPIIYSAWSLRYNIFFYLIFSCLIFSKGKTLRYLIGLWVTLILFINLNDIEIKSYLMSFIFNKVNLNFVLGCCCAYISLNFPIKHGKLFVTLGVSGYIFTWITVLNDLMQLDTFIMYSISAMFLILGLVSFDMNKNVRIPKIFNYLGNASFSIYLTHPPFLGLIAIIINKLGIHDLIGNLLSTLLCILIAIVMGCLAHSFIEKPLLARMRSVFLNPIRKPSSNPISA